MKITNSQIQLNGIRLYGFHGVSDEEQKVGSWFEINVCLNVKIATEALVADSLEGTVDYSKALAVIKDTFAIKSRLLEHLAYSISQHLARRFDKVTAIHIQIKKLAPPMPTNVDSSAVELTIEV